MVSSLFTLPYIGKKENLIFLIFKEIQSGAVAKSYMRKGFLIYEEMRKYFPIYEETVSHICMLHSKFPYIWGKFDFIFYQCTYQPPFRPCRGQFCPLFGQWLVGEMLAGIINPNQNFFIWQRPNKVSETWTQPVKSLIYTGAIIKVNCAEMHRTGYMWKNQRL